MLLAFVNRGFPLLDPQIFRLIVDNYASKIGATPPIAFKDFAREVGLLIAAFIAAAMVSGAAFQQLEKARNDSRDIISQFVNTVFISSITLLIVAGYSFRLHWSIGAALLVVVPVLAVLTSRLSRRIKQVQKKIFKETTGLAGSTTESLRNIELIKSLGLETQEIGRLNSVNAKILKLELQKVRTVRVLMFSQGTAIPP